MSEQMKEDHKTMQVIREALDNDEDVEVRKDKEGKLKIIASKKRRLKVD